MSQLIFFVVVVAVVAIMLLPPTRRAVIGKVRSVRKTVVDARRRRDWKGGPAVVQAAILAVEERAHRGGRALTLVEVGVSEHDFLRLYPFAEELQLQLRRDLTTRVDQLPHDARARVRCHDVRLQLRELPGMRRHEAAVVGMDDGVMTEDFRKEPTKVASEGETVWAGVPAPPTVPMVRAVLRSGTTDHKILADTVTVGRARSNSVVVRSAHLSAQHATITRDGEQWSIVDSSSNGTWVDGVRIERGATHFLEDGAIVRFADRSFTFGVRS